jgi:hypothetical protein
MPNYIQDPNDSKKQIPGPPSEKMHDRYNNPVPCRYTKSPTYVMMTSATTAADSVGFFFGTSASFAAKSVSEGGGGTLNLTIGSGSLTASAQYHSFGVLTAGQRLDISPTAFSASNAISSSILFVYRGGLDGLGRP